MTPEPSLVLGQTRTIRFQPSAGNAQKRFTVGFHRRLVRLSSRDFQHSDSTRHQQISFGLPVDVFRLIFDLVSAHLGNEGFSRVSL